MPRDLCKEAVHERRGAPALRFFPATDKNYLLRLLFRKFCTSASKRFAAGESLHLFLGFVCDAFLLRGGRRLFRILKRRIAALLRRVEQFKTVRQFRICTLIMGRNVFDERWICAN